MPEENKYTLDDLVNYSATQKPIEFNDAFGALMVDRLNAAIDTKRQEIARTMFVSGDPEDEDEDVEDEVEDDSDWEETESEDESFEGEEEE